MISSSDYIKQSLALHLFFGRIMKEHSFFLEVGFVPKDQNLIEQADMYRRAFDRMMNDVVSMSNGVVNQDVLSSGEVVTQYTLTGRSRQQSIITGHTAGNKHTNKPRKA
jgi:hypothetical protein